MNCCCGLIFAKEYDKKSIPLKSIDVQCDVHNLIANIKSMLTYTNTESEAIEAVFIFPLDAGAAVYHFEAEIGDRRVVAECKEKVEAKDTYERAIDAGHTAFLLEEDSRSGDTFRCAVGNIAPGGTVRIHLKVVNELELRGGSGPEDPPLLALVMPSVLNPRYNPHPEKDNFNQQIPFAKPTATSEALYNFTFAGHIRASQAITAVTSAKDKFTLVYKSPSKTEAEVHLESKFSFDHDLELLISYEHPHSPCLAYERGREAVPTGQSSGLLDLDCVMVNFLPLINQQATTRGRNEFVFVIDRSGSMGGSNITHAKEALLLFLKSLPVDCRFQIIGFGSRFDSLFTEPQDYTEESLNRALDYQKSLDADMGGTEVLAPLENIYGRAPAPQWIRHVFLLTDGDVSNTDEVISLVSRHSSTTRMFAVGIGEGASTALVSGVASAGGGRAEFIRDSGQLRSAVMSLLRSAVQPRFTDVTVQWTLPEGVRAITVPTYLPPIFSGRYLTLFGLLDGDLSKMRSGAATGSVVLRGLLEDREQQFKLDLVVPAAGSRDTDLPIHRLTAKSQIREMTDRSSDKEKEKEGEAANKQGIVLISTQANVISRFTAFIGVDPTEQVTGRPTSGHPKTVPVPRVMQMRTMRMACPPMATACLARSVAFGSAAPMQQMHIAKRCAAGGMFNAISTEAAPPMSITVRLADAQKFSGSWQLDDKLAGIVGVKLDKLRSGMPRGISEEVWATVVALAYLESHEAAERDQWEMMATKARSWLERNGAKVDDLMAEASAMLVG